MKVFLKLTYYEIKKMICRKYIFVTLLCLTAALGWYMYTCFKVDYKEWNGQIELYKNIEGMLTEDKYNFLIEEMLTIKNSLPDERIAEPEHTETEKGKYMPTRAADEIVLQNAIEKCNFIFINEENRHLIMQRAMENVEEYINSTDKDYKYQIAFNQKIYNTYDNQPQIYIMNPLNKIMWYSCLTFNIHAPMIIMLIIMVVAPLFVQEKETSMQSLINTYEKGNRKLFFSKLSAAFIITVFIAVYFETIQFVFFKALVPGLSGISYPIQSVIPQCPFNISIGGFMLIKLLYVSTASVFICMVIMLFSVISSKTTKCIGLSAIFAFLSYGIVFYQKIWKTEVLKETVSPHTAERLSELKVWLFTYLFYPMDYYEKFECVNVLNHPFFPQTILVGATIAGIIIVISASYFLYLKQKN